MWPPRRRSDRNALSRYWNALVSGASDDVLDPLAAALDPEQLSVVERLRSRPRNVPDPAFVARLERELLRDLVIAGASSTRMRSVTPPAVNGGIPPRSFGFPLVGEPRRWAWAPVITALLVMITFVAVYLTIIRTREEPDTIPIIAPEATPATPAADATPAAVATPTSVPIWLRMPLPPVAAAFTWQVDGPASTGTGRSSTLSIAPNGQIWVLDGANGRFQIFNADGNLIEPWGEPGAGEGQFDFQRDSGDVVGAIAFTPFHADEDFYVADSQNARVQQFDADRNFIRSWGESGTGDGQFLEPVSLAVSFEGQVYVADDQRNDVQVFSADGEYLRTIGGQGSEEGQFDRPAWFAFSGLGHFYVADPGNHRVEQFCCSNMPRLDHMETYGAPGSGDGELVEPLALAVDSKSRVYVADRGQTRIPVYVDDGRFSNTIDGAASGGVAFVGPNGIAIDGEDNLYVLDDNGSTVTLQKFRLILP